MADETPVMTGAALVVVADGVRARLLAAASPAAPLIDIDALLNPLARLHENDIVEDAGGRRNSRPTQAKRSRLGGESAKEHRIEEFARQVCERIGRAVREQHIDRIYLIAEPRVLGLLRKRLDRPLQRQVVGEVDKSLADKPLEQIREVLPDRL